MSGRLRVTCTDNFANRYLAPDLVETLPPHPDPAMLPWIGWRDEGFNRLMLTDHFPGAEVRHRVDGLIELGTMARTGLGVAMIGCFAADPDPGLVRVYPEPVTDAAMDLWVLTHPDLVHVARVR